VRISGPRNDGDLAPGIARQLQSCGRPGNAAANDQDFSFCQAIPLREVFYANGVREFQPRVTPWGRHGECFLTLKELVKSCFNSNLFREHLQRLT